MEMLPKFKTIESKFKELERMLMKKQVFQHSIVKESNKIELYEGDCIKFEQENGDFHEILIKNHQVKKEYSDEEFKSLGPEKILTEMSKELAEILNKELLEKIDLAIEDNNNTIQVAKDNFYDFILESMKRMPVHFKNGDFNKPTEFQILCSPNTMDKIKNNISPEKTEEFNLKMHNLLKEKYEEYLIDLEKRTIIDD